MKLGPVWVLLLSWLPLVWIASRGHGAPPPPPPPPPPAVTPDAPTISTAPLRFGDGTRPQVLRPAEVKLVMRRTGPTTIAVYYDQALLGELREVDGKFSGTAFAVLLDRSNFWIKAKFEIAREPEVPRPALEAVAHALATGGAIQQTFRVLEPAEQR